MTKTPTELPSGVLKSDLAYPTHGELDYEAGDHGSLTLYQVDGRREHYWCIATLFIGRGRQHADRTYAIKLDGAMVRVGKGPHVKQTLRLYVRKSRRAALQKFLDLYIKGMGEAGQIRDRISSRRAQGQLERASGHRSWLWND